MIGLWLLGTNSSAQNGSFWLRGLVISGICYWRAHDAGLTVILGTFRGIDSMYSPHGMSKSGMQTSLDIVFFIPSGAFCWAVFVLK